MIKENKVKLPDNHRRSLSVTAHHIENSIDIIEKLFKNKSKDKLTEKIVYSLNDEIKNKILELLSLIRIKNETMFYELELNVYNSYEERIVRSNIGHIWALLCDSTPESLKGYGEISSQQAESIKLHVNSLLETVDEIQSIIK
ncbi:MAG: hypothetical protein WCE54_19675 [Ignavibacteriaceae bacterium]